MWRRERKGNEMGPIILLIILILIILLLASCIKIVPQAQAYVVELVGKTDRTIMNIENKGQHPSFNLFFKLVTMFDISVDQFFYREEQRDEHSCRKHIMLVSNVIYIAETMKQTYPNRN